MGGSGLVEVSCSWQSNQFQFVLRMGKARLDFQAAVTYGCREETISIISLRQSIPFFCNQLISSRPHPKGKDAIIRITPKDCRGMEMTQRLDVVVEEWSWRTKNHP